MALLAGHDLSLTASTDGTPTKITHQVTGLEAGGTLAVAAGNDALLEGTTIKAGGTAALQAGNDLTLTTVTDSSTTTASWKEGKKHITQTTTDETVRGVTVDAGKGGQIAAGHDATLDATTVSSGGDITVAAGHDLTLGAEDETHTVVTDTKKKKSGLFSSKTTTTHDTSNETLAVGTTLSGDNVHLVAGNDLTAEGAAVKATGDIALAAGHDVNLLATTDSYSSTHDETVKKSGFTLNRGGGIVQAGKKTVTNDDTAQHVANGTLLSGDSVSIAAGHDLLGEGTKIAGTHDVVVAASNNLSLTTAVDIYDDSHSKTVTKTGYSKSGMNELYGQAKDSRSERSHQVTHTSSVVGSTDGQVTLTAGGDLHLTGTDVISKTGTTIVGKNVTIDAGLDTLDTTQSQKHSEGGITGGLGGGLYDLAMDVRNSAVRANDTDDGRLKALYAAKAAYEVKDGVQVIQGISGVTDAQSAAGATGINVQVGIGGSSASSKTTTHDSTSYGGHITSGGNVTIGATGGDLTIIGGEVTGKNVALASTHDINLLSQSEEHSLKNDSKNSAGSIGVSFGSDGFGIYASATVGSGKAHGNGSTHAETTINADDKLTIVSGNDTTIEGAQLKGNQVVADIGNNLTIRSEQDTHDYASKTMQAGGKIMVGITQSGFVSGSAYYAASKVDSHYTSVNEVSGIKAGDGGFQIDVGGTTHLVGGQIASAADASQNVLSTGNLVWEDLHNESKYNASQMSFSGGSTVASNVAGAIGAAISMATPQHGNSSSDTKSGISQGSIVVRNDPGKDLSSLDRNPTLSDGALKNTYDAEKIANRQDLAAVAGYVGMRSAGAISDYMKQHASTDEDRAAWSDGGRDKVILHGLVGAATAALSDGNVGKSASGAVAGEAVSQVMQDYLTSHGVSPQDPDFNALMQLGAAAVGGAVGGGQGAAIAVQGELFNRQLHRDADPSKDEKTIIDNVLAKQYAERHPGMSVDQASKILESAASVMLDATAGSNAHYDPVAMQEAQGFLRGYALSQGNPTVGYDQFGQPVPLFGVSAPYQYKDTTIFGPNPQTAIGPESLGMRQVSDWAKGVAEGFADAPQNILKGTVDLLRNPSGSLAQSQQAMQYVFQQGQNGNFGPAGQVEGAQLAGVVLGIVGNELAGGLLGRGSSASTAWPQNEAAFWQSVDLSSYGATGSSGGLIGQGQVPVYTNPLIHGGNGSPLFALGLDGAAAPRTTAAGVLLDPRLPDPVAGTNYVPAMVDSSNPNIANSHVNGYVSELQLANQVVALPNQQVIKFGDAVGTHGSDVISVDASTGEVYLWDSKFRSGSTSISQSPTFANSKTQLAATKEAQESIANANLPEAVKQKALENLQNGTFVTNTVGAGSAKNSYQVRYCGGKVCN